MAGARIQSQTTSRTQTVPNMVQGVSQQGDAVRRPTQAEAQFDCLNHAAEGCTARPGIEWMGKLSSADHSDAYFYDIKRSKAERYSVVVRKDGVVKAYNYLTGTECTLSVINAAATTYLSTLPTGVLPWQNYVATSADDVTFIANKSVTPAMDSTSAASSRPPEALFSFKAGGYQVQYQIGVKYSGTWYNWSYTTPDNSVPGNAQYITPSAICYALYNAMVSDPTHPIVSGLGFNIQRNGNIIRLWRTDGHDFDITTDDAEAGNFMIGMKGEISNFDKLPQTGYDGMVFKVQGDVSSQADDYWVKFDSQAAAADSVQGLWVETVAPGTLTKLDATKMPVALVNSDVNTFSLGLSDLGARVAGDAINSSKDPSFVGRGIQHIFFDQRRLAVMTDYSCTWSRTNNPYVFFPDTVQADLDTAPIDEQVKASERIAVLHKPLQAGSKSYLWAEGQQFLVDHISNTVFSDKSIESKPASTYEWNEDVQPLAIGSSVVFCYEVGDWTNFTDATYSDGASVGETGISDHVPRYIPSGVRFIAGSDTLKKIVAYSETTPSLLYIYEYRLNGTERQQSAWSIWRLPTGCHVVHALFDRHLLYIYAQRADGLHLFKCSLQAAQADPEGVFLTRLDMRVNETKCTVSYNATTKQTSITLPFDYSDSNDHVQATSSNPTLRIVTRLDDGTNGFIRGVPLEIVSTSVVGGKTVAVVNGDYHLATFYAGLRIRSERQEGTYYVHDSNDTYIHFDRLQVEQVTLLHTGSGAFRAEVSAVNGRVFKNYYFGPHYGDPGTVFDKVILGSGAFDVPVNQLNTDVTVTFINDDYLPSAWNGLIWFYTGTARAVNGG